MSLIKSDRRTSSLSNGDLFPQVVINVCVVVVVHLVCYQICQIKSVIVSFSHQSPWRIIILGDFRRLEINLWVVA